MRDETVALLAKSAEACIDCRRCVEGSPLLSSADLSPKALWRALAGGERHALHLRCLFCGYCAARCPKGLSFRDAFLALREGAFARGEMPPLFGVRLHQRLSRSRLFYRGVQGQGGRAFFPGCSLMSAGAGRVQAVYRDLLRVDPDMAYVNGCCMKPTRYMGDREAFWLAFRALESELEGAGVRELVVACENCLVTFRECLRSIRVGSLYAVLADSPVLPKVSDDRRFALHDPCPTRLDDALHEDVRRLLNRVGVSFSELPHARRETLCCGEGAFLPMLDRPLAAAHRLRRMEESDLPFVTYCQSCTKAFRGAGKACVHLLELLYPKGGAQGNGLLGGWRERWRCRYAIR